MQNFRCSIMLVFSKSSVVKRVFKICKLTKNDFFGNIPILVQYLLLNSGVYKFERIHFKYYISFKSDLISESDLILFSEKELRRAE